MMLFAGAAAAAFIQPSGCLELSKLTAPSHALDSHVLFVSERWPLQPQAGPWCRDGSSETWVWKPLTDRSEERTKPSPSAWG